MATFDVIVAGLGAMGSAAAYHLAARGRRVLGLDRFHPPHDFGSSHGRSRIIREAYFEDPRYVPLVQRAYQLWAELEAASARALLVQIGGLMVGPPEGVLVSGAIRSARQHHLEHEVLTAQQLRDQFSIFHPSEEMAAVWEPRAGILFPELAVQTHLELAAKNGAMLRFDEPVLRWKGEREGIRVETPAGTYTANQLLCSAGAWMGSLIPALPLTVERQVMFWFEPLGGAEDFQPGKCPVHIWEYAPHRFFYGFPDLGDGIKAAIHHQGEPTNPDHVHREVEADEITTMRHLLRRFLPAAVGRLKSTAVCLYTNTPDEHFLIDRHPADPRVLLVSACSGHGFKFSPVIGELAANLLEDRPVPFDLALFKLGRFAKSLALRPND